MAVIAVDISIAYQSAGQSLAKLWVAYRSPLTYPRNTNYHAQAYAPAKIESRVYDLHNCLLHSYAAQSYQGIYPCGKRFGHGLDTIAFQLPRATPPPGGKSILVHSLIGFRNLCQIFREYKDKIVGKKD